MKTKILADFQICISVPLIKFTAKCELVFVFTKKTIVHRGFILKSHFEVKRKSIGAF